MLFLAALLTAPQQPPPAEFTLPPGFVAERVAGPELANDIYTLAIDPVGRVLVAGKGYVRVLTGTGPATRAIDLIPGLPDGPMGLLADGDSLYVVAGGGLKRYRGYDGQTPLTTPPETLLSVKTAGEHDAHAVLRGPDGWLYLLCGNMAGFPRDRINPGTSPVKDPVAGLLARLRPDGSQVEVVADGFRNAYGFDFDRHGVPHTCDSDNERCVGLPWFEPCRFYRVIPGGNYGWRTPQTGVTWRKPPYFPDVVAPVCTTGRASPTGVACYRHTHFPAHYHGGFFLADWTFGRIHFVPAGAATPEVFLEPTGSSGFAPTALAVHPSTGELYVAVGGRGTRGSVYRIRAVGREAGTVTPVVLKPANPAAPLPTVDVNSPPAELAVRDIRAFHLAFGDLTAATASGTGYEGYTLRLPVPAEVARRWHGPLVQAYLTGDTDTSREALRTLAAVNDPSLALVTTVIGKAGGEKDVPERMHQLLCLSPADGPPTGHPHPADGRPAGDARRRGRRGPHAPRPPLAVAGGRDCRRTGQA